MYIDTGILTNLDTKTSTVGLSHHMCHVDKQYISYRHRIYNLRCICVRNT
jgi:hypothetical protein